MFLCQRLYYFSLGMIGISEFLLKHQMYNLYSTVSFARRTQVDIIPLQPAEICRWRILSLCGIKVTANRN